MDLCFPGFSLDETKAKSPLTSARPLVKFLHFSTLLLPRQGRENSDDPAVPQNRYLFARLAVSGQGLGDPELNPAIDPFGEIKFGVLLLEVLFRRKNLNHAAISPYRNFPAGFAMLFERPGHSKVYASPDAFGEVVFWFRLHLDCV
jgi:hypothetical protein